MPEFSMSDADDALIEAVQQALILAQVSSDPRGEAKAAIAAVRSHDPGRFATVPRHPTLEMFAAARPIVSSQDFAHEMWRRMIKAYERAP